MRWSRTAPSMPLLWALLLLARAVPLRRSFSATIERTTFASETGIEITTTGDFVADESRLLLAFPAYTPDGRRAGTVKYFDGEAKGSYQVEPFFDEEVCFAFDLSKETGNPHEDWLNDLYLNLGVTAADLNDVLPGVEAEVDGRKCRMYMLNRTKGVAVKTLAVCIGAGGELLQSNQTTVLSSLDPPISFGVRVTLRHYCSTPGDVHVPKCVDLRSTTLECRDHELINEENRIARINRVAGDRWRAARNANFQSSSVEKARRLLMSTQLRPMTLPLKMAVGLERGRLPESFDARARWATCDSIRRVANQGSCGACWAVAAASVLSDRLCIADGSNITISVEYMLRCDGTDAGCDGGFVDNAWRFLKTTGAPEEACVPYLPDGAGPRESRSCPDRCDNGSVPQLFRAVSAYAVAQPGDFQGIQLELLTSGSVHVAFFVFDDFLNYKNGTYVRTPESQVQGGHSVRLLGWGIDSLSVDYWLVANSWSTSWGMNGLFQIKRGSNECGIETTPAAGQAFTKSSTKAIVV